MPPKFGELAGKEYSIFVEYVANIWRLNENILNFKKYILKYVLIEYKYSLILKKDNFHKICSNFLIVSLTRLLTFLNQN